MHKVRNEEIIKKFGNNLRILRTSMGKTQEQLAEDAGISQVQIARIENGRINTSLSTIYRIIEGLGVKANELFH